MQQQKCKHHTRARPSCCLLRREHRTTRNAFIQIHVLLNYSHCDYVTRPGNALAGTLFWWPSCSFNVFQAVCWPSQWLAQRVKPKANTRACEGKQRQREINKVTAVFIHHASEGTDEDLPVPSAQLAFHWTIWQFTPQSQLSHLKPFSTPTPPILSLILLLLCSIFLWIFLQISLDTAVKGCGGQMDKRMLHKGGGDTKDM